MDGAADARSCSRGASARAGSATRATRSLWKQVDEHRRRGALGGALRAARASSSGSFVARSSSTGSRRGEDIDFVQAGSEAFDPTYLTVGFARRLATYKRLNLLVHDAERALSLLDHDRPLQFVFAGKAHPLDDAAKAFAQRMFDLKRVPEVGNKVVFLEDYDLSHRHDRSSPAATCGSTCRARPSRRAGRAG